MAQGTSQQVSGEISNFRGWLTCTLPPGLLSGVLPLVRSGSPFSRVTHSVRSGASSAQPAHTTDVLMVSSDNVNHGH